MKSTQTIISLTKNKTRKLTLMLNDELLELFKKSCKKNNIKLTTLIEGWIIDYIDENGFLK